MPRIRPTQQSRADRAAGAPRDAGADARALRRRPSPGGGSPCPGRGRFRLVLAALCLAPLIGCASLVKEPRVSLARVGLASIGFSGATARVELLVENPNPFALDARAVEYALAFDPAYGSDTSDGGGGVEWLTLATGRSADPITLESGESTPVTLLVPFTYQELGTALASLLRERGLRYRFSGSFTVGSPVGDLRIPFDRTGLLDP